MSFISSDIMPILVEFLDRKDRAKMAMINKAWNRCLYRNNIWGEDRWMPQAGTIGSVLHLPKGARHIGTPYKACFFYWLDNQRFVLSKSISEYYRDWKQIGSPCIYIQHHQFEDTLIASTFYKELSSSKKLYIFHRFATYELREDINRYSLFLQSLLREFTNIQLHLPVSRPIAESSYSDLSTLFHYKSQNIILANQAELRMYIQQYIHRLRGCIQALERRGTASWIQNEAAFAKDPMMIWDSIAFKF